MRASDGSRYTAHEAHVKLLIWRVLHAPRFTTRGVMMASDLSKKQLPPQLSMSEIKAQARALKQRAGWDPAKQAREPPLEAMQRLNQAQANATVYEETTACAECGAARDAQQDDTALCAQHLAEVMGF